MEDQTKDAALSTMFEADSSEPDFTGPSTTGTRRVLEALEPGFAETSAVNLHLAHMRLVIRHGCIQPAMLYIANLTVTEQG